MPVRPTRVQMLTMLERATQLVNRAALGVSMVALHAAAFVLTYSVVSRYFFHAATDWQDEAAVFCLTGATFLCGAWVQSQRGHVGIDAIANVCSPRVNAWRLLLVDVLTFTFCAFFAWKSWSLWHQSWVERTTTSSTFAPPLAIPYGLMAAGMTLLALQVLLQVLAHRLPAASR